MRERDGGCGAPIRGRHSTLRQSFNQIDCATGKQGVGSSMQ